MIDIQSQTAQQILAWAIETYGDEFAISTSFQKEGMAVLDMAARISPNVRVFTLDTGRLPDETHQMIEMVRERYGIAPEIVHPDAEEVRSMVKQRGGDLFYESVEGRRLCCDVRKVRPLARKLATLRAWATGIRREQSSTRAHTPRIALDAAPVKINPIADWTAAQVECYTRRNAVPVHPLYARGYTSIGCEPCTRATLPGEDPRAGRWWWETDAPKECGIHISLDGIARRAV